MENSLKNKIIKFQIPENIRLEEDDTDLSIKS